MMRSLCAPPSLNLSGGRVAVEETRAKESRRRSIGDERFERLQWR